MTRPNRQNESRCDNDHEPRNVGLQAPHRNARGRARDGVVVPLDVGSRDICSPGAMLDRS